jgi:HAD superfamily hydrolase (TIGR01549 family)
MIKAILFDLDETLILDEPVVRNAFLMTARTVTRDNTNAHTLARAAESHTRRYWATLPPLALEYATRIGHSALEGLWADYNSSLEPERILESEMNRIRLLAWADALEETDLDADAVELSERWIALRSRYPLYPDADELLSSLHGQYKLGIVTNGVAGLQRKKWHGSGLETWFDAVAISGEVGIGKPERGIFEWIAKELEVELEECVMVGDNSDRDVQGGINAGMKTVWLDRGLKPKTVGADLECKELLEILPWLRAGLKG